MIHLLAAVPCLIVNYIAVCNFCGFAANGMPFVVRSRLCSVIRSTSRKNIFSVRVSMSARRLFHLLLVYLKYIPNAAVPMHRLPLVFKTYVTALYHCAKSCFCRIGMTAKRQADLRTFSSKKVP